MPPECGAGSPNIPAARSSGPEGLPRRPSGPTRARSHRSPWQRFWAPDRLAWWVAVLFVIGSVGFIVGSLPGFGTGDGFPTAEQESGALIVKIGFLLGGLAFTVGSYLMLPEFFEELDREEDETAEAAN